MNFEMDPSLDLYVSAALEKKGIGIVVLDVHELTSIADVFIILSGRSHRQATAIAESIVRKLKKIKIKPLSVEGLKDGQWVLIDYGHIVIHVFYEPIRHFYDLEGLWSDAKRITTKSMANIKENDKQNLETELNHE